MVLLLYMWDNIKEWYFFNRNAVANRNAIDEDAAIVVDNFKISSVSAADTYSVASVEEEVIMRPASNMLGYPGAQGPPGQRSPGGMYLHHGGHHQGPTPASSSMHMHTPKHYVGGGGEMPYGEEQDYQQLGGLRRLDSSASIRAHFYPEGGWGWIVCACAFLAHVTTSGAQLSSGALHIVLSNKFKDQDTYAHYWLGPLSWSVSSLCSPLIVNLCRRKNVRVLSFVGGILFPLSLVFTSFATELHQIFFSFGLIGGIGSCIVRESSNIVLGEYFKKRRNFVEQVVLAGTGVGVTLFSLLFLSFTRHVDWSTGFRIGAALCSICLVLPAFYRAASVYHPNRNLIEQYKHQRQLNKTSGSLGTPNTSAAASILLPLGGDIFHSLHLFCIPSLKPVLWSAAISSFGLYAPIFLMSDFGKKENLTGGSLLLLQTHLGLGISLGVILGAILTLKKFRCFHITPRMLCCATCALTGLSMIAISSVKGYYGYSLSAWIYGVALGAYLYSLKILTMDLTRTKYWSRIWSCVQSIMAPGILLGSGATCFMGKPGFYACATCVLLGAGLIGFHFIDLSKCSSPPLSSLESNESPIPPLPPPLYHHHHHQFHQNKYPSGSSLLPGSAPGSGLLPPLTPSLSHRQSGSGQQQHQQSDSPGGSFFPLRKSMSQPMFYPPQQQQQSQQSNLTSSAYWPPPPPEPFLPFTYSPHCPDCNPSTLSHHHQHHQGLPRSLSLPQELPEFKTTGTQTNPNSPERHPATPATSQQHHQSNFDHRAVEQRLIQQQQKQQQQSSIRQHSRQASTGSTGESTGREHNKTTSALQQSYKHSVVFASNPQLYPQSSFSSQTDSSRPPSAAHYYTNNTPPYHLHYHHSTYHYQQQLQQLQQQQQQRPQEPQRGRRFENASAARGQQDERPKTPKPQKSVQLVVDETPKPAFTRHYFDSSKILQNKRGANQQQAPPKKEPQAPPKQQAPPSTQTLQKYPLQKQPHVGGAATDSATAGATPQPKQQESVDSLSTIQEPPSVQYFTAMANQAYRASKSGRQAPPPTSSGFSYQQQPKRPEASSASSYRPQQQQQQPHRHQQPKLHQAPPSQVPQTQPHQYYHAQLPSYAPPPKQYKISSSEFDVEEPKFHSLRRPTSANSYSNPPSYYEPAPSTSAAAATSFGVPQFQAHQAMYNVHPPHGPMVMGHHHQHQQFQQAPQGHAHHQNHRPMAGGSSSRAAAPGGAVGGDACTSCAYCDPDKQGCPPLALNVPLMQPGDPHLMCHYGVNNTNNPMLRRRNTWHFHKDYLEAITTSV